MQKMFLSNFLWGVDRVQGLFEGPQTKKGAPLDNYYLCAC